MNKTNNALKLITYPSLCKYNSLVHFTSTRDGGVSDGSFSSLNLGLYSGDESRNIEENYFRLLSEINIERNQIHLPYQTHGNSVCLIDTEFLKMDAHSQAKKLHGVDALITNVPRQCIAISTADCVPILIFDPVNHAIAAIHAGWRSTCSRIVKHTISKMQLEYNCLPENLKVVIGPSISPEVYVVGKELVVEFEKQEFDTGKIFAQKNGNTHLDLWTANVLTMQASGVLSANIEVSGYCTYQLHEQFFSARRLGLQSGRMASGIMLKQ